MEVGSDAQMFTSELLKRWYIPRYICDLSRMGRGVGSAGWSSFNMQSKLIRYVSTYLIMSYSIAPM